MKLYLDTDVFLALMKEKDRHKLAAEKFMANQKETCFVTSTLTCLEIWFYLYRNNFGNKALDAVRAVKAIAEVWDIQQANLESGLILAQEYNLSPADAVHAILAKKTDGIVSSDHSFDKIPQLNKINFTS